MSLKTWTRDFFLANQQECLAKLQNITLEERKLLIENLEEPENKLVLLKGGLMISDSLEPEYYCGKVVIKSNTGSERVESGRFTSKIQVNDGETISDQMNSLANYENLLERQTIIITRPKSTNQWVLEADTPKVSNHKRKAEDVKTSESSFVVKVYEKFDKPLNTLLEVIGFLTVADAKNGNEPKSSEEFEQNPSEHLPAYTIHAVYLKELPHNNPLLIYPNEETYVCEDIHRELVKLLTQFMFGDELAAHYILLHLISSVYARVNGEILGKFSLNLICSAVSKDVISEHILKFYNFLELILTDSIYFPMTLENLNGTAFAPKKDYATNRLTTGLLQLPENCHLLLDETRLESGKLENSGCLAVADLSGLIRTQQVNYDFGFYKIPFNHNIAVMIMSEGKSLLPNDVVLPLKPEMDAVKLINENVAAGVHFLKPKLNAVRKYLSECRLSDFQIGDTEKKVVEDDFVKMREEQNLQVEHLHTLLVVSRLVGISTGKKSLDIITWNTAKAFEFERMARVEKLNSNES